MQTAEAFIWIIQTAEASLLGNLQKQQTIMQTIYSYLSATLILLLLLLLLLLFLLLLLVL